MSGGGKSNKKKLDKALAEDVVREATAAMRMIADQTPTRTSKGKTALEQWKGPDADRFRGQFSTMQKDAQSLHGQLQTLIRQVNNAIDSAG